MSYEIINPKSLGEPRGWNNGMLGPAGGRVLLIAGQIGTDEAGVIHHTSLAEQFGVALKNSATVVQEAGGSVSDIGRLTVYVTDVDEYRSNLKDIGAAYRSVMGRHFPAMALVAVSALVHPDAVVEVEATAIIPPREQDDAKEAPDVG